MNHLRKLAFGLPLSAPGQCALCAARRQDHHRLVQLVGLLPVGQPVRLDQLRACMGTSFKAVISDLQHLQFGLNVPVKRTRRGYLLSAPVPLCEHCKQIPVIARAHEGQTGAGLFQAQAARRLKPASPP